MIASSIVQVSGHQAIHDDHATYWAYILYGVCCRMLSRDGFTWSMTCALPLGRDNEDWIGYSVRVIATWSMRYRVWGRSSTSSRRHRPTPLPGNYYAGAVVPWHDDSHISLSLVVTTRINVIRVWHQVMEWGCLSLHPTRVRWLSCLGNGHSDAHLYAPSSLGLGSWLSFHTIYSVLWTVFLDYEVLYSILYAL